MKRRYIVFAAFPLLGLIALIGCSASSDTSDVLFAPSSGDVGASLTPLQSDGVATIKGTVTYDGGYDGSAALFMLPADAIGLILRMVKIEYDAWKTGGMSVNTLSIGGFGLSVVQDWPRHLKRQLDGLKNDARLMFMESGRL